MDWITSKNLIDYQEALNIMETKVDNILNKNHTEAIWLLEHPNVYTAGTSAKSKDLKNPNKFPVITTNRGGQFTYHGPGQRIVYLMINLKRFDFDIRKYIYFLEELVIASLDDFNIESHRWKQAIGVWTYKNSNYSSDDLPRYKIASIGIRVRHKIAFHGIAVNIFTNLSNFNGIIPCGIKNAKVTSVLDHGHRIELSDFDTALKSNFYKLLK